jgi:F-type H+-transporting ATPase subunit c
MSDLTALTNMSNFADYAAAAIALGIIVIGASGGIGFIGSKALDALSRQPESKNDIMSLMVISAALIEGIAFFSAIICLLIVFTK